MTEPVNQVNRIKQVVPPEYCADCDVCCRFPEADSFLAPYFTGDEVVSAVAGGIDRDYFAACIEGGRRLKPAEAVFALSEKGPYLNMETERRLKPAATVCGEVSHLTAGNGAGLNSGSSVCQSGCRITLRPYREGYICPAFHPATAHCSIYAVRPFDCVLYPFAIMLDITGRDVVLGMDSKCPYIRESKESSNLRDTCRSIAAAIESSPLLNIITANRGLIGPFQEDVFPLMVLQGLADRL